MNLQSRMLMILICFFLISLEMVWMELYFQYNKLVQGGFHDNILNALEINQNEIVRIYLNKYALKGSTNENYREFGVLPVRYIYKKIVIMHLLTIFKLYYNNYKNLGNKRKFRNYDFPVKYIHKYFSHSFVDYLGPSLFGFSLYIYF